MEYALERTQVAPVSLDEAFAFFADPANLEAITPSWLRFHWEHTHRLSPAEGGTEIHDHVRYGVPGGPFARLLQHDLVGPWLDEIFDYRAERMRELLA